MFYPHDLSYTGYKSRLFSLFSFLRRGCLVSVRVTLLVSGRTGRGRGSVERRVVHEAFVVGGPTSYSRYLNVWGQRVSPRH